MSDEQKRRVRNAGAWGDLDESARVARQEAEQARVAREAKTSRLRAIRLGLRSEEAYTDVITVDPSTRTRAE